jgi:hypothetical protein
MGDRENANVCGHLHVDHVIRKAGHRASANGQIGRQPSDQRSSTRHCHNPIDRRVNGVKEFDAKMFALGFVPSTAMRSGIRRPLHRRSEREGSPLAQFSPSAAAYVVPRGARGFVSQGSAGTPLDFGGPGGLHLSGLVDRSVLKAGQELGRNIRPLVKGQGQGFAHQILRS